ncbi:hypothetical protein A2U01_0050478, partial [Trifolium medium]|nr:hypothetical protein [Trifolium medium]
MIEDVLVKVKDLAFLVDFVIIDVDLADERDIILGRPFLATSHACINMKQGEVTIEMKEEVRTIKVYGKSTNACCKVEVRDKDLEKANLNSEWIEERGEEESFESQESSEEATAETEEGKIASCTPEEILVHHVDELNYQLCKMKEYDVRTLKVVRREMQEWVERI